MSELDEKAFEVARKAYLAADEDGECTDLRIGITAYLTAQHATQGQVPTREELALQIHSAWIGEGLSRLNDDDRPFNRIADLFLALLSRTQGQGPLQVTDELLDFLETQIDEWRDQGKAGLADQLASLLAARTPEPAQARSLPSEYDIACEVAYLGHGDGIGGLEKEEVATALRIATGIRKLFLDAPEPAQGAVVVDEALADAIAAAMASAKRFRADGEHDSADTLEAFAMQLEAGRHRGAARHATLVVDEALAERFANAYVKILSDQGLTAWTGVHAKHVLTAMLAVGLDKLVSHPGPDDYACNVHDLEQLLSAASRELETANKRCKELEEQVVHEACAITHVDVERAEARAEAAGKRASNVQHWLGLSRGQTDTAIAQRDAAEAALADCRALLERIVKYATEDRARTPGSTRLWRALDEASALLAATSKAEAGKREPFPRIYMGEFLDEHGQPTGHLMVDDSRNEKTIRGPALPAQPTPASLEREPTLADLFPETAKPDWAKESFSVYHNLRCLEDRVARLERNVPDAEQATVGKEGGGDV